MTIFTGAFGKTIGTKMERLYGTLDSGALNSFGVLEGENDGHVSDAEIMYALLNFEPSKLEKIIQSADQSVRAVYEEQLLAISSRVVWTSAIFVSLYPDGKNMQWSEFEKLFPNLYDLPPKKWT